MGTRGVVLATVFGVLGAATALFVALAWGAPAAGCGGVPGASPMHWLRCLGLAKWADPGPQRWEADIQGFEQADRSARPARGALLFVGSSTIARWRTLDQDFPGVPVINRGFGGSQIKDTTHFAERIVFPYAPSAIFFRAGGNDIHAGWPAEAVFQDFQAFVAKVRARLPDVPIYFIGLNPSVKRLDQAAEGQKLNGLVAGWAAQVPGLTYIDAYAVSVDAAGRVMPELFEADRLHLNPQGYQRLAAQLRPHVLAAAAAASAAGSAATSASQAGAGRTHPGPGQP